MADIGNNIIICTTALVVKSKRVSCRAIEKSLHLAGGERHVNFCTQYIITMINSVRDCLSFLRTEQEYNECETGYIIVFNLFEQHDVFSAVLHSNPHNVRVYFIDTKNVNAMCFSAARLFVCVCYAKVS